MQYNALIHAQNVLNATWSAPPAARLFGLHVFFKWSCWEPLFSGGFVCFVLIPLGACLWLVDDSCVGSISLPLAWCWHFHGRWHVWYLRVVEHLLSSQRLAKLPFTLWFFGVERAVSKIWSVFAECGEHAHKANRLQIFVVVAFLLARDSPSRTLLTYTTTIWVIGRLRGGGR